MTTKELLTLVLDAVKRSERSFICCAIEQFAQGNKDLELAAMKAVEKYKPKGKQQYIGWWSLYDRKSRVDALEKAIKDLS